MIDPFLLIACLPISLFMWIDSLVQYFKTKHPGWMASAISSCGLGLFIIAVLVSGAWQ